MAEMVSLADWMLASASRPGAIVASARGESVAAAEFREQVLSWRARFLASAGSRVAIHSEDALVFAQMLFGAWHAGWEVVLPADRLPATCERLRAHADAFAGDFPPHLPRPATGGTADGVEIRALDPDCTQLLLFTSGSTGEPVAIRKRLRQLEAEVTALEQAFGEQLGSAGVGGTVSQQHIYGLLFRVLWPMAAGRPYMAERLATPEQIAAVGDERMVLIASPAHLKRLPENIDWTALREKLVAVFSSGGPLSAEAGKDVLRLWGLSAREVFGSTETGGIAHRVGAASAWTALPGVQWRIDDDQLEVRSPHLANEDWLRCADRARIVGDGFELLGRGDRIAKIEERRISLTAIETNLLEDAMVAEARVVVLQGARSFVAAAVVLSASGRSFLANEGKRAVSARLTSRLRDSLDATALPKRWRFVDALPTDARGKCTESSLQRLFRVTRPPVVSRKSGIDSADFDLQVPTELAVFDGHFPGTPVVPGVALIDWAIHFARSSFDLPPLFRRADVLKFQALIRPDTPLHLRLDWRDADATLVFRYDSALGPHASGRLLFQGSDA